MTKVEILERELNYQLKVYKGKTKKYQELKEQLELYKLINFIAVLLNQ